MAQKRELVKMVAQVVVALREGDRVVAEESGLFASGPEGPVWVAGATQPIYGSENTQAFYEEQEALCKAAHQQANRATRRRK